MTKNAVADLLAEFPQWRHRLMVAGFYRTAQAMQAAQDMIPADIEDIKRRADAALKEHKP